MKSHIVFGYGSLMNADSLATTVPGPRKLLASYIQGYQRDFSYWAAQGFTVSNLDVAGIPLAALNVHAVADPTSQTNGVTFQVTDDELEWLKQREYGYEVLEAPFYDYQTDKVAGRCVFFASSQTVETFDVTSPSQRRYVDICITGAKTFGPVFYQEFLDTTMADGQTLGQRLQTSL